MSQVLNRNVELSVMDRYSGAAKAAEPALCCPTKYDPQLLAALPAEVLERDYGCGNPSAYLVAGESVLDLGSGSGKVCFIASQVVGPAGRVVGIDMNDDMLSLARESTPEVAQRIGHDNVVFKKGRIQDLALDLDELDGYLRAEPVKSAADFARLEREIDILRREKPLVASDSIDVVMSSCVLNLVKPEDKRQLFQEIFRVLRRGGRAVISDIVCDEDVPVAMQNDPELWSGCISGAFREDLFLEAFAQAGFYGMEIVARQDEPWRTVEGIEFRSLTVVAYKGKQGPCFDQKHAVIYRGPFSAVVDDDGHTLSRGVRSAVCEKTYRIYSGEPYRAHLELVPPRELVPLDQAPPFPCSAGTLVRDPKETKSADYRATTEPRADRGNGSGCC